MDTLMSPAAIVRTTSNCRLSNPVNGGLEPVRQ